MIIELVSEASRITFMILCRTRGVNQCDSQTVFAHLWHGGVDRGLMFDTITPVQGRIGCSFKKTKAKTDSCCLVNISHA